MSDRKFDQGYFELSFHYDPSYLKLQFQHKTYKKGKFDSNELMAFLLDVKNLNDVQKHYSEIFNQDNCQEEMVYVLLYEPFKASPKHPKWFYVGETWKGIKRFYSHKHNEELTSVIIITWKPSKSGEFPKSRERLSYESLVKKYLEKHLNYYCQNSNDPNIKHKYENSGLVKEYIKLLLGYSRFYSKAERKINLEQPLVKKESNYISFDSIVYKGYVKDGAKQKCSVQLKINNPNDWSINIIKGVKFRAKDNLKSLSFGQHKEAMNVKSKLDKYKEANKLNYLWLKNQFFEVTVLKDISVPKGSNISALIKGSSSNINDDVIINYNGHERTLGWMRDHGIILQSLRKKGYSSNLNHKSSASFVYQGYVKDGLKAKCEVWLQINSAKDWYINIKKGIEFKTENCLDSKSSSYAEYAKTCKKRLISLAKENKIEYKEVFLNNKKFYAVKVIQDISFYKGKNISSLIRGHNTSIYNEVHIMYNNKYLTLSQLRDKGVI